MLDWTGRGAWREGVESRHIPWIPSGAIAGARRVCWVILSPSYSVRATPLNSWASRICWQSAADTAHTPSMALRLGNLLDIDIDLGDVMPAEEVVEYLRGMKV
jgi:hypothetical protein